MEELDGESVQNSIEGFQKTKTNDATKDSEQGCDLNPKVVFVVYQ